MSVHIPILVKPIVEALIEPFRRLPEHAPPHWIVDCTLGGGGHTAAILEAFSKESRLNKHGVLAVDQDPKAVAAAQERFSKELKEGRLRIIQARFGGIENLLKEFLVLGLLADLGFSSDQLEDSERGLSFRSEGPLDMRLDPTQGMSCAELLSQMTESDLEQVLSEYGEERFSKKIARAVVDCRRENRLPQTTRELAELVVWAIPSRFRHGRIHAATRTFQALRIAVNHELEELDHLLQNVASKVLLGGRVSVISFHSLEDRRVKQAFKDSSRFHVLTKKPVRSGLEETIHNPRAKSAKLRIAERVE